MTFFYINITIIIYFKYIEIYLDIFWFNDFNDQIHHCMIILLIFIINIL